MKRPTSFISLSKLRHRFEFQLLAGEEHQKIIQLNNIQKLLSKWIKPSQYKIINISIQNFRGYYIKLSQRKTIYF